MSMQQPSTIGLLLVEDDSEARTSLQFTLNRVGYTVLTATNEEQALAYIAQECIHLVVLGDSFAAKQGFTLCAELRRLSTLPIVILAELKHRDDLATAFRLGANDYIIKPVPPNVLLARLTAVLRRTKANTPRPLGQTGLSQEIGCFPLESG